MRSRLLVITAFLLLACSTQAQTTKKYLFSNLMYISLEKLSEVYRSHSTAREWNRVPSLAGDVHKQQLVSWKEGNDEQVAMFELYDGRVSFIRIVFGEKYYSTIEWNLNRHLVAVNDHEWLDLAGHTRYKLVRADGLCVMTLAPYRSKFKAKCVTC